MRCNDKLVWCDGFLSVRWSLFLGASWIRLSRPLPFFAAGSYGGGGAARRDPGKGLFLLVRLNEGKPVACGVGSYPRWVRGLLPCIGGPIEGRATRIGTEDQALWWFGHRLAGCDAGACGCLCVCERECACSYMYVCMDVCICTRACSGSVCVVAIADKPALPNSTKPLRLSTRRATRTGRIAGWPRAAYREWPGSSVWVRTQAGWRQLSGRTGQQQLQVVARCMSAALVWQDNE